MPGTLFIVATPIGNLGDMTERARRTLAEVALVAAEDTRHSGQLLAHFGLSVPLLAVHEHNESDRLDTVLERLRAGDDVALVTDAGTPLVSDPGYRLVAAAAAAGMRVVPVPGACAAIAALSVAGLPTDRFAFEGFLPQKAGARRARLQALTDETRTLVFYESPHRLTDTLTDIGEALGGQRAAVVARELTKLHETIYRGSVSELLTLAAADANMSRGEIVLAIAGRSDDGDQAGAHVYDASVRRLLEHAPVSVIADVVAELTGQRRNAVYDRILQLKRENGVAT